MEQAKRGLYNKFEVTRTDGKSAPGQKHHSCEYFVLDLDHDPHAKAALAAYAESCRVDYPRLSDDLVAKLVAKRFGGHHSQDCPRWRLDVECRSEDVCTCNQPSSAAPV